ncbi:MAG: sporulation protein YabP [Ruminococcaceae bacterium]|nr:sporulation protein YabP [Oscillospiraceae bacterium]
MLDEKRFTKPAPKEVIHNVILENRKRLTLSGIEDVDSFDEETIVLFADSGSLTVKGTGLHINKLSVETGEVSIEGEVDSLVYTDGESGKTRGMGFLARLFR